MIRLETGASKDDPEVRYLARWVVALRIETEDTW